MSLQRRYSVDVKAFINIIIDADDEDHARRLANEFVERLSPDPNFICGYNSVQIEGTIDPDETGGFDIDGLSEVEEAA